MARNTTGTIIGTLDAPILRELLLNYKGGDDTVKKRLLDWYDEAKRLESELGLKLKELVISRPEGF